MVNQNIQKNQIPKRLYSLYPRLVLCLVVFSVSLVESQEAPGNSVGPGAEWSVTVASINNQVPEHKPLVSLVSASSGNYDNYIAFNRGMDFQDIIDGIQISTGASLWIVDPDSPSTTLAQITPVEQGSSIMPSWGPENDRIVFASNRQSDFGIDPTPFLDIWTMQPDGSNMQRLTQSSGHDWTPAWSPDGQSIAFASTRNASPGDVDQVWTLDVFIMNADGTNQRFLADGGLQDEDPVFSKDSRTVYFVAEQSECFQIWEVPVSGGTPSPVLDNSANPICGEDPSLSPEGDSLFFFSNALGGFAELDLTTGEITPYSNNAFEPWIGPDGSRFTFVDSGEIFGNGNISLLTVSL